MSHNWVGDTCRIRMGMYGVFNLSLMSVMVVVVTILIKAHPKYHNEMFSHPSNPHPHKAQRLEVDLDVVWNHNDHIPNVKCLYDQVPRILSPEGEAPDTY